MSCKQKSCVIPLESLLKESVHPSSHLLRKPVRIARVMSGALATILDHEDECAPQEW